MIIIIIDRIRYCTTTNKREPKGSSHFTTSISNSSSSETSSAFVTYENRINWFISWQDEELSRSTSKRDHHVDGRSRFRVIALHERSRPSRSYHDNLNIQNTRNGPSSTSSSSSGSNSSSSSSSCSSDDTKKEKGIRK
ncbi:hypothetical protein PV328_001877, partial [Microctonus aethiopoides]